MVKIGGIRKESSVKFFMPVGFKEESQEFGTSRRLAVNTVFGPFKNDEELQKAIQKYSVYYPEHDEVFIIEGEIRSIE